MPRGRCRRLEESPICLPPQRDGAYHEVSLVTTLTGTCFCVHFSFIWRAVGLFGLDFTCEYGLCISEVVREPAPALYEAGCILSEVLIELYVHNILKPEIPGTTLLLPAFFVSLSLYSTISDLINLSCPLRSYRRGNVATRRQCVASYFPCPPPGPAQAKR